MWCKVYDIYFKGYFKNVMEVLCFIGWNDERIIGECFKKG